VGVFDLSFLVMAKVKIQQKSQISSSSNSAKQKVPCESIAKEVSFEWSHHRISFIDSKVRSTLQVSIIESRSERVKQAMKPHVVSYIWH